nr:retrovirus-related Pol polyprotein from transposon TNT 1-94 [Tanacetum cinerariifolium]
MTAPYTPEQNGVAERKNRTVVEMARSMLKSKGLPDNFWAEGVATAVYLINISPIKAVWNQTPYEAWYGNKPSVSHLRVFGSVCYALRTGHKHKLEDKSQKFIFVGYCTNSKAYRLFDPLTQRLSVSRNVVFDENVDWKWKDDNSNKKLVFEDDEEVQTQGEMLSNSYNATPTTGSHSSSLSSSPDKLSQSSSSNQSSSSKFRYAKSPPSSPPKGSSFNELSSVVSPHLRRITVEKAMQKEEWREAMEDELTSIKRNKTWEMTGLPKGKNTISLKWIYKTKFLSDGSIQKHKARLVARALAAQKQWKAHQFDVKSAFLNGDLHDEVYVDQPPGFEDASCPDKVLRLKKALYGLKQAPRAWYNKIDEFFQKEGFEKSKHEPTLYVKKEGNDDLLIVSLYVDDMIYTSSSTRLISKFKSSMKSMFEMADLGELQYFLGLEVIQKQEGIFLSQKKYIDDTLKKYNMINCNIEYTPMNPKDKFQAEDGTQLADGGKYRSLIGRLIYMTHTRPDISFAVGVLSRFMHQPTKHHLGAAKRILRYLSRSKELGIWYRKYDSFNLEGSSDSD